MPDKVPRSTKGEDIGHRGIRARHGHSCENQDGKSAQGEGRMLRY